MPIKKIKHALTKKRKITYKEMEYDYLPLIVLFAVVAGILTLLFILLAVYQDIVLNEEVTRVKSFRNIENFLRGEEENDTEDIYYLEEQDFEEVDLEE